MEEDLAVVSCIGSIADIMITYLEKILRIKCERKKTPLFHIIR